MTGYTRKWTCQVCGGKQETISWPDIEVCPRCIGSEKMADTIGEDILKMAAADIARSAYVRGFRHGRALESMSVRRPKGPR